MEYNGIGQLERAKHTEHMLEVIGGDECRFSYI